MKTFKYSFLPKQIYRYANIPANLIMLFYLLASILGMQHDWKFVFPLLINLILLYVLNKFYFRMYKTFPFKVQINNEEMICSDFVLNNREVKIKLLDIKEITGGIFTGRAFMPLYIKTDNEKLGFSPHMKDFNNLLKIILTNVTKELYESLLERITKIAKENTPTRKKK